MDKTWMTKSRTSREYREGVDAFINFAFQNACHSGKIYCPCVRCGNRRMQTLDECRVHLVINGILTGYTRWDCHGERSLSQSTFNPFIPSSFAPNPFMENRTIGEQNPRRQDNIEGLLHDALGINTDRFNEENVGPEFDTERTNEELGEENRKFLELLKDAESELFPGCTTFLKLSFILHLFHLKCMQGWKKEGFESVLQLFMDMHPDASIPRSYYEAKKLINALGLSYEKIHACPNDCMLYWGEKADQESCHVCGQSRWKGEVEADMSSTRNRKKRIAAKVLRYFPLIPRLKRLFLSEKTSNDMRWHDEGRKKDGLLRHPADGEAWKTFDTRFPDFSSESRNVRLGLISDGFNPFRTMNINYSTWPVLLVPYNFPPWIGMKQSSFILSMIIPGQKGPGNDIDVFLQPLIEELKQLWEGVETYDASKKENFTMRASLLWTINDFPAYAYLSGYSTKGKFACPNCNENTPSQWLNCGGKHSYMGHRRWLPEGHTYRNQRRYFDGKVELRLAPKPVSGTNVLSQLEGKIFILGKSKEQRNEHGKRKRRRKDDSEKIQTNSNTIGWKKKSVFFNLPYWKYNLLRHNLDVMHIEKNVCDNLVGTLLSLEKKSKDNLKARFDLQDLGIRPELHPVELENGKGYKLPPACFTMSKDEKKILCGVLKGIKTPDGYASNISRCVNLETLKINGLKSHDCHILIEEIFPLALQACSPSKHVMSIVIGLATFFKALCSKVLDIAKLDELQSHIIITLCNMEKVFLPSFFTVMVHLMVHLVDEAKLGGPVQYRWMYPFERYFVCLKSYVRNRAYPEGSIAEGYLAEECLTFCSRYLDGVATRFNRPPRNPNAMTSTQALYLFGSAGEPIGKIENIVLDEKSRIQAHRYVLRHCDDVEPYRLEFQLLERRKRRRSTHLSTTDMDKLINEKFHDWFFSKVHENDSSSMSERILALGRGPNSVGRRFSGLSINGYRFRTKARETGLKTQNSGVVNVSEIGEVNYYGRLNDIIELNYYGAFKVILFKCDWVDVHHATGMKRDGFGFTFVNFNRLIHTGDKLEHDPYVFASQVEQVFYVKDPKNANWSMVVRTKPRDVFDMGNEIVLDDNLANSNMENIDSEQLSWVRTDVNEHEIVED